MVQLRVLSGKQAGTETVARRFPFLIGRGGEAHLRLDEAGVWDQHARLDFQPGEGFRLTALGEALVTVNACPASETVLRNGDRFSLGSVQLGFWLAETRQRGLRLREALVWSCVGLVTAGQLALLHWLLQ